jgi:adenosylmethionine---8-amino-7-oxononanoate aminotransferase
MSHFALVNFNLYLNLTSGHILNKSLQANLLFDQQHIWHPYTSAIDPLPCYQVVGAQGVHIQLATGETLVDGVSSWWTAIHGYNHPLLNQALAEQSHQFAHVMFGGLTHEPAIELCRTLLSITPSGLNRVFLADSGSVSIEVAMKMALQYWACQGNGHKHKFITPRNGYHGDTFAAMSVCDPINGMHSLFSEALTQQIFAPAPQTRFDRHWNEDDTQSLQQLIEQHHHEIAALVLEPIVQNAGGMRIYHPNYLKRCRQLCDDYNILLICDEIATGFGRTGLMFACEHADISPDIMCVGKALTGGYLSLAATLCSEDVAQGVCQGEPGVFMHGPTFMGNALACAVANASLSILATGAWQQQVKEIEKQLRQELEPCRGLSAVADVRVLGAIGVVECKAAVNVAELQRKWVAQGVWIRPFGKLIYIMPPYIIKSEELRQLTQAIYSVLR